MPSGRQSCWRAGRHPPFRSIARRAAHEKLPHRILLFYANRRLEDAPFLDEFNGLARENPNFEFIPTMTQISGSYRPWTGTTGHIDRGMIERYLQDDTSLRSNSTTPIHCIPGPPRMVAGLRTMLNDAGIDDDNIRTEEFTGY